MPAPSLIGPPDDLGGAPDSGDSAESPSGGVTVTVPLDLLSQDGVPPGQGDQVQAQIDATVKSVDGSNATLSIDAIDGQPVGQPDISGGAGGAPAPGSSAAMKAALMAGAGQNQMGIG
jgi:hypothetical protein